MLPTYKICYCSPLSLLWIWWETQPKEASNSSNWMLHVAKTFDITVYFIHKRYFIPIAKSRYIWWDILVTKEHATNTPEIGNWMDRKVIVLVNWKLSSANYSGSHESYHILHFHACASSPTHDVDHQSIYTWSNRAPLPELAAALSWIKTGINGTMYSELWADHKVDNPCSRNQRLHQLQVTDYVEHTLLQSTSQNLQYVRPLP